jgi:hypothetical protein
MKLDIESFVTLKDLSGELLKIPGENLNYITAHTQISKAAHEVDQYKHDYKTSEQVRGSESPMCTNCSTALNQIEDRLQIHFNAMEKRLLESMRQITCQLETKLDHLTQRLDHTITQNL